MNRRTELILLTLLFLLAAALRITDLSRLPLGFTDDELAHIRITETVREGDIAVHYPMDDGRGRTGMYGIGNRLATDIAGDGLFGYRMFPFWGSLVSLAVLYRLARRLFGPPIALIALALVAVNLRAILLARTATPEAFVPGYTMLMLYVLTRAFYLRRDVTFRAPDTLWFALLALLAGMSGYLHYTLLVLGPLAALFLAHLILTHQPISRQMVNALVFVIVLATVIAVPYLISTLRDVSASEPYILWEQRPRSLTDIVDGTLHAVGGMIWRGDPDPAHNLPDAALVGPLLALLLITGVIEAGRRWRDPRYGLLLLVLLAGLITDAWVGVDATFSANLVALPAVFLLVGIGLDVLRRTLRTRGLQTAWGAVGMLVVLILAANVISLRSRLFDDFKHDETVLAAYHGDLGQLAAYLDRTTWDLPASVCMAGLTTPNGVGLSPYQMLQVMLHREDLDLRHSDCRSGIVFINAGAPMRFILPHPEDIELMPPELREWLSDVPPLEARGMPPGTVLYMDVEDRIRDMGGFWDFRAPTYFMPGADDRIERVDLPVRLEQNLTFAGYDPRLYAGRHIPGGSPIVLVSYWRVDGPLPPEMSIFAHLLAQPNPQLAPVAEANAIDVIPSELRRRDLFAQVSYIWLDEALPSGDYTLTVGAFTGSVTVIENHLDVLDSALNNQPHGDRLLLGRVLVEPPPDGNSAGE
ncbi:MAG: glycosyltransferase family 39 protein [Anaerolineae bacterium]|nr:glycosyltransferase family 39 protein [Anaerolineae bacterium]